MIMPYFLAGLTPRGCGFEVNWRWNVLYANGSVFQWFKLDFEFCVNSDDETMLCKKVVNFKNSVSIACLASVFDIASGQLKLDKSCVLDCLLSCGVSCSHFSNCRHLLKIRVCMGGMGVYFFPVAGFCSAGNP